MQRTWKLKSAEHGDEASGKPRSNFSPRAWDVVILLLAGVYAPAWRNGDRRHCIVSWHHQDHVSILVCRYDCSYGIGQEEQRAVIY